MRLNKPYLLFILAITAQLLLLAAVPAPKILPRIVGDPVVLKIAPVDPYNIFSGYYLNLSYEISRLDHLEKDLEARAEGSTPIYVVLVEGDDGIWQAVSCHAKRPSTRPAGAVVIKGRKHLRWIQYGIESFYVPEDERETIEAYLRKHIDEVVAEVKVGPLGNAVLLRIRIGDRVYEY